MNTSLLFVNLNQAITFNWMDPIDRFNIYLTLDYEGCNIEQIFSFMKKLEKFDFKSLKIYNASNVVIYAILKSESELVVEISVMYGNKKTVKQLGKQKLFSRAYCYNIAIMPPEAMLSNIEFRFYLELSSIFETGGCKVYEKTS